MINFNIQQPGWGIRPVLFNFFDFPVSSYSFFVFLGLVLGIAIYLYQVKDQKDKDSTYILLFAAVIGGIIGAKVPIWIINFNTITSNFDLYAFLSGRTIIGGLIGGIISVIYARSRLGIKKKSGNLFVPALSLSFCVGRIGCLLYGCCYGKPTNLPWGLNFGDGIRRHPTQIYEILFFLIWFIVSFYLIQKKYIIKPGLLFEIFIVSYFTFRFSIEFVRFEPTYLFGLTLAQNVSVLVVLYFLISIFLKKGKNG